MNFSIVIPAYKPTKSLVDLVEQLRNIGLNKNILIVDDGSGETYQALFKSLLQFNVEVIHHEHNLGKGAALKTAFSYWKKNYSENEIGLITVDADGQHLPDDVLKISQCFLKEPHALVIGTRSFNQRKIPLRSLLGNRLTQFLFSKFSGTQLADTQSGLRAIPKNLIDKMIKSHNDRYEFEFEMLFEAIDQGIAIDEVDITTIYINQNETSHFNPITDSMKIYYVLFRFASISIISGLLDLIIFLLIFYASHSIMVSVLGGRIISGGFNFMLNKHFSFHYSGHFLHSSIKYFSLAVMIAFAAMYLISFFHYDLKIHIVLSKILAESILYFISFYIQKHFIFNKKSIDVTTHS